ncbi:unnamed protein product [Arabis nemorensis]|uniref:Uncharacterized protein n=1 Tax=Arabis nemorensis TaxID=586526 RepID=A0A565BRC4_9BRAS|nr:unnamed protein product [Arabis nemorensis]
MDSLEQGRETKRRRCMEKKRPFIITIKQAWKYSPTKIQIPNDIFEEILMKLFIKTVTLEEETASLEHTRPHNFKGEFLEVSESSDGLVCIHDTSIPVRVMNPATGVSISLPLANIQQLLIDHPHPALQLT